MVIRTMRPDVVSVVTSQFKAIPGVGIAMTSSIGAKGLLCDCFEGVGVIRF
jgi:hypothetical protein